MTLNKTPVFILGGGPSGLAAAVELARRGVYSLIAEKEERLGGKVAGFCCKAVDSCVHCGACRLGDLIQEVEKRPEITVWTRANLASAQPEGRGWSLELTPAPGHGNPARRTASPLAEKTRVEAGAVILAVGYEPFNPALKSRFGYGRAPGVISALELEAMLGAGVLMGADGAEAKKIAFIQCVGSRDKSLGRLYCSRVCCAYALDMARLIRSGRPETEVTFFHMDVQGYGPGWEAALPGLKEDIRFVRAMPGEVAKGENGPKVVFSTGGDSPAWEEFDLVVLSVGMGPVNGIEELAGGFGFKRTADGFIGDDADFCKTGADGVFVAGSARGPKGIVESIDHAALAASAACLYLIEPGKEAAHA